MVKSFAKSASRSSAETAIKQRFGQDKEQDETIGVSDGFQYCEFADALAHGDRHGVAGDEQQREEHDSADRENQEFDVAELFDPASGEAFFVSVLVSYGELANLSSMALTTRAASSG